MLMNLLSHAGERSEAVLLATSDHKMRIIVRGRNDATELRRISDQWISENGTAIDIESLIAMAPANAERPRTMTAAS